MGLDGQGLDIDKLLLGGGSLVDLAHGLGGQGQGHQPGKDMSGKMKDFHQKGEADKRPQHQPGIDQAGVFEAQANS